MAKPTPYELFLVREEELRTRSTVHERRIRLCDGIELAADVYLPAETSSPVPAIVEVTPYDKRNPLHIVAEAQFYQRNGYAFLAVDVRGRGKSDGVWQAFVHDARDTYDVVEWVAEQDWCDGKIGMTGLSYMGWVQWAAAAQRPPHLRCLVSTSAAGRWQQEIPYTNGVFQLFFAWWLARLGRRSGPSAGATAQDWSSVLGTLPVDAIADVLDLDGPTWTSLMTHDTLDSFWRSLRFEERYAGIDVPCLHVTGWYDLEDLLGAFHHYERMVADSPAADRQRLLVGPWSHVQSRFPDSRCGGRDFGESAVVDMDSVHLRWFDHWLRGADNGVTDEARVRVFEPGTDQWRSLPHWPGSTDELVYCLRFDGTRGSLGIPAPVADPPRRYTYDPADPVPTGIDVAGYPIQDVPLEQTETQGRSDVLGYTSAPLAQTVVVSGWASLELFAASDSTDTDWHVRLLDVHPDGRCYRVTQGCLRAACHRSLTHAQPLVPEEIYRFAIELWPTQYAFLPGHRIRITVTSSDFPWFARNLNSFGPVATAREIRVATNTVYHDADHVSRLRLPIERAAQDRRPVGHNAMED